MEIKTQIQDKHFQGVFSHLLLHIMPMEDSGFDPSENPEHRQFVIDSFVANLDAFIEQYRADKANDFKGVNTEVVDKLLELLSKSKLVGHERN